MSLVRNVGRWLGRVALATSVLFAAGIVFWVTAPLPVRQSVVFDAMAQVGCVPNPNINGPPNIVNGCSLTASWLNTILSSSFQLFTVQSYGAKGDGSTNDTAAVNAAFAACATNGGIVYFPATGHSYALATAPNAVPANCQIRGITGPGFNYPTGGFYDNTEAHWTVSGAWLKCQDTTNPCLVFSNAGAGINGINFWYTQPTPAVTTACGTPCTYTSGFTPTTYPYTIKVTANNTAIEKVHIVNATHCIDLEGPTTGVFGKNTILSDLYLGCFVRGTLFHRADNILAVRDVHYNIEWFQDSSDILGYTEKNKIDWDVQYWADPFVEGVEFLNSAIAIQFTDATVTSGFGAVTFAMADAVLVNVNFNEVCKAIAVASSTTHVSGKFRNVVFYTDSTTSNATSGGNCAGNVSGGGAQNGYAYGIDLNSDNVNVTIDGLALGFVQTVARVGGGASGVLRIRDANTVTAVSSSTYSTYAGGGQAFVCNAGATFDINDGSLQYMKPAAGGGAVFGGCIPPSLVVNGVDIANFSGQQRQLLFGTFASSPTTNVPASLWDLAVNTSNSQLQVDHYNGAGSVDGTPMSISTTNGYTVFGANVAMSGGAFASTPTITSGFGTSPSIAGSDNASRVTVGTGGAASGVIGFGVAFNTSAPVCVANDETTSQAMRATPTTSNVTITGTMSASDKVSVLCIGIQ